MLDQFDVSLEDHDLLEEVELTINLMAATTGFAEPLPLQDIDRFLGVTQQ